MNNTYDDVLNELVYQIDDIVYKFYTESNELIATKSDQERLITFRDKTLNTINDMNVRSLEIIAGFKDDSLMDERANQLLEKNHELVASSLEVLNSAPDRSEFLDDLGNLATGIYDSAKVQLKKVEDSGALDKIKENAALGFKKLQKGIEDIAKHPSVVKGTETIKEKAAEAADAGSKWVKEGSEALNKWVDEQNIKSKAHNVKDKADDIVDDVADHVDDAVTTAADSAHDVLAAVDEFVEHGEDDLHDVIHSGEEHVEVALDKAEDLTESVLDGVNDTKETIETKANAALAEVDEKVATTQDAIADEARKISDEA